MCHVLRTTSWTFYLEIDSTGVEVGNPRNPGPDSPKGLRGGEFLCGYIDPIS